MLNRAAIEGSLIFYYHSLMVDVHVLRVFVNECGEFGDIATVVFDEGRGISVHARMEIAGALEAVETVFVNDLATRDVSFVHGGGEIDFAGVPALGVAWLLGQREGAPISQLKGRQGEINVAQEKDMTWVQASLNAMPPWNHVQYSNADKVDRISLSESADWEHVMVWAWIDEHAGLIRARTFATDWGIQEAAGNGSGSLLLACLLDRTIEVHHGDGSVIHARPAHAGFGEVGGRVFGGSSIIAFDAGLK